MINEEISSGVSSTDGGACSVGGGTVTVAKNASKSRFRSKFGITNELGSSSVGVFNSSPSNSSEI
jgi:hypothetical protein